MNIKHSVHTNHSVSKKIWDLRLFRADHVVKILHFQFSSKQFYWLIGFGVKRSAKGSPVIRLAHASCQYIALGVINPALAKSAL